MSYRVTCIIPFYNEGDRILRVVEEIVKVKNISQIICVDDGSTDNSFEMIGKQYSQVEIIKLPQNTGKAQAITEAVKKAKYDYILTLDGDLRFLQSKEIDLALEKKINSPWIDMIILRHTKAPFTVKLNRGDLILSGDRILKKSDLLEVAKLNPEDYNLELMLNQYMIDHHKKAYWMPSSALNTYKFKKYGFFRGVKKDALIMFKMILNIGFVNYLKQVLFFCHKQAVTIRE